jgi:hypothetical protein
MTTIQEVDSKVDSHIDVCTVRYESLDKEIRGVNARLKRIEQLIMTVAGSIILLLVGIVVRGIHV